MTKVKHTPVPYNNNLNDGHVYDDGGMMVANCYSSFRGEQTIKANAKFVTKACNNHDKLVEALEFGIKHIEKGINATPTGEPRNEMTNFVILAKHFLESLKD